MTDQAERDERWFRGTDEDEWWIEVELEEELKQLKKEEQREEEDLQSWETYQ